MSESLIQRVRDGLTGLAMLSDGKTTNLNSKINGGEEAGGLTLLRDKSPLEFHTSELEQLCERMETRIAQERRFVAPPATKAQEDYWFREQYEGKDYRTVADRENMEADDVWRKRERMGLNGKDGRPMERAA
jgi:hypothetical protein